MRSNVKRQSHRIRPRGQALVLAIIALLALCVGVIVVFDTGQAVSRKVDLVDAADAAAYSAAVEQARAYNLIAYMNRAEVANQVAMAQMTSWYAWTNFALRGTDNFKDAVQDIAIILDLTGVGAEVGAALQEVVTVLNEVKGAIKVGRDSMQELFSAGATAISVLDNAYSLASRAIANVESQEALKLVPDVVKRNTEGKATIGARGYALLEQSALQARNYVTHYTIPSSGTHSAGADRFANVVMEARDDFSRSRSGNFLMLHKRGGTDLVNYKDWVGVDTLDFDFLADIPLAWGGAAAVNSTSRSFRSVASPGYGHGKGWDSGYEVDRGHYKRYDGGIDNGEAGRKVLGSPAVGGASKAWIHNFGVGSPGLQPYDDIASDKATVPYDDGATAAQLGVAAVDVGPTFNVLVEQPLKTIRTSANVEGIGGPPDFQMTEQAPGNSMTALSSAQVYFSRPRDLGLFESITSPSSRELGNLFSPYWQARLVDTSCNVRQEVAVAYGAVAPCVPDVP